MLVLDRHDFNEMLELAMPPVAPKLLAVVGARMRPIEEQTASTPPSASDVTRIREVAPHLTS